MQEAEHGEFVNDQVDWNTLEEMAVELNDNVD